MLKVLAHSLSVFMLAGIPLALAQEADPADADVAAPTEDTPRAGTGAAEADDGLEEIVLRREDEADEEPYLDELDEPIVDNESETDAERLSRLFTLYLNAVSDRQFEEADTLAKQVVELTIRTYGLDSDESAKALTNLAIAQHGINDFESAILNYEAAIGIIERIEDRLSHDLINPLRGLGAAQLASGRPDLARDSFNRAVHISHVNEGPHNLGQVETLESLAETFLSVGEFEDAVDVQKRIYYLQARGVNSNSLDIIPALRTRAGWQHRMQLYDQERFTWRRVISVIQDNKGDDSLDLIEPLTRLGNSYLFVGFSDSPYAQTASVTSGEVYLKRAIRVAEANTEAGWEVLTDTMLELGDYYLRSARPHRAERVYEEVWRILSDGDDEEKLQARAEQLESATVLQDITPPKMYGGDPGVPLRGAPPGYETGTAVYEYTVSVRGTPMNIRLVDSDPEGLDDMYEAVARDVRRLIYRPKIEDGEMSMSEGVTYTHSFYYRQADLPEGTTAARADGVESTEDP
jgi:tetratricopeptide (TPR) repeat protein